MKMTGPPRSPIGYLVAEGREDAIKTCMLDYRFDRIGIWRFVSPQSEDIRVVDRIGEFISFGPGTRIWRGRGFNRRVDAAKWQGLVDDGLACWGPTVEEHLAPAASPQPIDDFDTPQAASTVESDR